MKKRLYSFNIIDTSVPYLKSKGECQIVLSENLVGKGGLFSITKDGKTHFGISGGSSPSVRKVGDSTSVHWMGSKVRKLSKG